MNLPLVIVNPTSAAGATAEAWFQIASDLRSQFGAFQNVFTISTGHALTLASEAARKGVTLIIACGGDGTVSEVANGILASGKDVELGIVPSGTCGDFFFFQAEDGIRDLTVTGVQTCALPIFAQLLLDRRELVLEVEDEAVLGLELRLDRLRLAFEGLERDRELLLLLVERLGLAREIGRASCRERVRFPVDSRRRGEKRMHRQP